MKKLFALALSLSMLSGVYGLTIGIGGAYEDVTDELGGGAYFAAKIDAIVPVLPILKVRGNLLNVDFVTDTPIKFGTFTGTDLLVILPLPAMFQPYVVAGAWFEKDVSMSFKGGLGAEIGFGTVSGYLEGGVNYTKPDVGDATMPVYIQGGVRVPIQLGL